MSIVLTSTSGPDSKLHLEIPVGQPGAEFEVEIVVRPKLVAQPHDYQMFLERSAGAWQGELERPPQPLVEERESF